ncbi:anaerobic sulfatase maturase [Verrucomicrobiota bacterium]
MNPFSLLIKPASADCNLRCAYCFYLDRAALYPDVSVHRMSDDTLERLIAGYMGTDQAQYAFGWQGGEPTLMGTGFFQRVTALQKKYGHRGAIVANGLQTNATLITDEMASHFARYKFLLGVSLDGPESVHDVYRRSPGGSGSHSAVIRGIERLKQHGVEFNILTLVTRANVRRVSEIYHYLCDNGFLYHQYIPCVEFDASGTPLPYAITGEEWGGFLCRLYDGWIAADTRRVSIRLFDAILSKLIGGRASICHMGTNCCQYFLVEYNGDIYPCDFFVEKALNLGNVAATTWDRVRELPLYRRFGSRKNQWNDECASCKWKDLCAGDCLKHRLYAGNDSRTLSWLCRGWKQFFAHSLSGFQQMARQIQKEQVRSFRPGNAETGAAPGRNDPCLCGSGLKYKQCCLTKRTHS